MDKKRYEKAQIGYSVGYLLSALLTLAIYIAVTLGTWQGATMAFIALVAAALQLAVQSRFFLHLKRGKEKHWQLTTYIFAWIMLLIVVVGSLWVMINLNYRMGMSPSEMLDKIQVENSKGF